MEKKEAMKILKDFHDKSALFSVRTALDTVFPELKESEDERVKKELIELISCMHDADPRKKGWIAWLEKQGETFTKKDVEDAYLQGVCDAKQELEKQGEPFDDNIITRDDEILQAISIGLTDVEKDLGWSDFGGLPIEEIHAWLEKQGNTSKEVTYTQEVEVGNGNIKALVTEKLDSTNTSTEDDVRRRSTIRVLEYARTLDTYNQYGKADIDKNIAWLEKPSESDEILSNSKKIGKNDTLLDLLNKIPSYITVDGIYYHFMLRKAVIYYIAYYKGEGEGGGKVIFWMAGEPIELLTAMLEKLKEEGLLE